MLKVHNLVMDLGSQRGPGRSRTRSALPRFRNQLTLRENWYATEAEAIRPARSVHSFIDNLCFLQWKVHRRSTGARQADKHGTEQRFIGCSDAQGAHEKTPAIVSQQEDRLMVHLHWRPAPNATQLRVQLLPCIPHGGQELVPTVSTRIRPRTGWAQEGVELRSWRCGQQKQRRS